MREKRIINVLKLALGLPAFQIANLIAHARQKQSTAASIATVVMFLPIVALTTAIWAFCWVTLAWLLYRAVN